jgi:hypothetical protein
MGTKLLNWKELNNFTVDKKLTKVRISGAFYSMNFDMYFSIIKWLGYEIGHWPPSSTEVKNEWSSTSTPPICLHGKDKNNFTFYIYIFLSLFTQTISLFIYFLKVKPTLRLHAYIIKEIQYCYAEVIYMHKAARCQQRQIRMQKFEKYFVVNNINKTLEGRYYWINSNLWISHFCGYVCSNAPFMCFW